MSSSTALIRGLEPQLGNKNKYGAGGTHTPLPSSFSQSFSTILLFLPVEHRSYNRVFKISSTILIPPTGFWAIFFQAHIFAFLTPKMNSLTPKTWEMSPNNKEIGPNITYPVSRGLETGMAVPKMLPLIKLRRCLFF